MSPLRALLAREKDEDAPKLTILLAESLVAVYMCLLIYALAMYDANVLYRLTSHPFIERMWPALFGGGIKKLVMVQTADNQSRESFIHILSFPWPNNFGRGDQTSGLCSSPG